MNFDLSGIPPYLKEYIEDALKARSDTLRFVEKEIKQAMDEVINEIRDGIGHGVFRGVNKNLDKILDQQKEKFARRLDDIIYNGLIRSSYAGLSIGRGILERLNKQGVNARIIHTDLIGQAEAIAKSTMEKKRYFKKKPFVISERIWDISGNNLNEIKKILEGGINTDCVKVAKALQKYVKKGVGTLSKDYPEMMARMKGRVPGNLNYEALRLARNELSDTYWNSTIEGYNNNPAISAVKWLISTNRIPGYHDVCDEMAYSDNHGLGAGIYPLSEAPNKAHVNCLCNIAPIISDEIGKKGTANTPPKNWEEIKTRLNGIKSKSFINMKELTEEQKEARRKRQREAYRRRAEKKKAKKLKVNLEKAEKLVYNKETPLIQNCLNAGIPYNPVKKIKKPISETEIIKRISGGDKTKGSCSSLAFAYAGNKAGYDVLDFRGGKSRDFFATNGQIKNISELKGVKSFVEVDYSDFKCLRKILVNVNENKEYYLAAGSHASIIKKEKGLIKYLELQSKFKEENGFHLLTDRALKKRFKCQKSYTSHKMKLKTRCVLIDIETLNNNKDFKKLLGFLNTNTTKQKRGTDGSIK